MYRSSPFRITLNTSYITGLGMCEVCTEAVQSVALWTEAVHSVALWTCNTSQLWACEVCTEAVHSVALWTRVTSQVWACVKYVPKQSVTWHFEHELRHRFGHVWSMYRSSPFRSTLDRSSPFRSTLNMCYITALGMCEVCTEAVHSVALWTRVTSQLWTYVKYVPKQSIP